MCWTLKQLFSLKGQPPLVFKGGTSLSKVFGLIDRFSEDIDVAFDRTWFGFVDDRDPENAPSRKATEKLIKDLHAACEAHIASVLLPALNESFDAAEPLGDWALSIDPGDTQALAFEYPQSLGTDVYGGATYVQRRVLIELGARSDHSPAGDYPIRPYAADEFPDLFEDSATTVHTLEARRTFWEKATLLHWLYHRQNPSEKYVLRNSRHYYDLAMMAQSPVRDHAVGETELLSRVVQHKSVYFKAAWARYDEAATGALHLVPNDELLGLLEADYERMQEMFFSDPPTFDEIGKILQDLEEEVNRQLAS